MADDLNDVGFTVEWGWFAHAIHATIITKEKHKLWLTRCIYSNANSYRYTSHLYQVWSDPVTSGIFCSGIKEKKKKKNQKWLLHTSGPGRWICDLLLNSCNSFLQGFFSCSTQKCPHKQNLIFPCFRTYIWSCAPCWFVPMRIFYSNHKARLVCVSLCEKVLCVF